MATFKLVEKAVTDVKAYLQTNLPAKLDALDTEYADGIMLDDIKAFYIAEQDVPETPALFVLASSSNLTERGHDDRFDPRHRMTVGVMVNEQDTEKLRKRIYRYIRAIIELLHQGEDSAGLPYVFDLENANYSSIFVDRDNRFIADGQVEFVAIKNPEEGA